MNKSELDTLMDSFLNSSTAAAYLAEITVKEIEAQHPEIPESQSNAIKAMTAALGVVLTETIARKDIEGFFGIMTYGLNAMAQIVYYMDHTTVNTEPNAFEAWADTNL